MSESVDLDKVKAFLDDMRDDPSTSGADLCDDTRACARHIAALVAEVERLRAEAWARHHTNPFA